MIARKGLKKEQSREKAAKPGAEPLKALLLHDIRSVHNVGSIFRTADGFGVDVIYISGHTPTPIDRFGRARPDLAKVALGAEISVTWKSVEDPVDFLRKMKKNGAQVIALEQDAKSIDIWDIQKSETPAILVLGNEVDGVSPQLLKLADMIVEIPMVGEKESFNVSVAAGIAMFRLFS
jgi:23S rRNA (guanosine2251-2'-O)-methyltransferase